MEVTRIPNEEKSTAMLAHLLGLLGFLGPLIVFLVTDEKIKPYAKAEAQEALNFQLFIVMCEIIALALTFIFIGFLLFPLILLYWLIFTIIAGVKANTGEIFRYPLTIRFIPAASNYPASPANDNQNVQQ